MKRFLSVLLCLLLLSGCSKAPEDSSPAEPFGLEIEYGESAVTALAVDAQDDPLTILEEIPFLNKARPAELNLRFGSKPTSFSVLYRTDADGYAAATEAVIPGTVLPAPTDDAAYLFEITAVWQDTQQRFLFRFLPQRSGSQEASPLLIPKLAPSDLFGIVVVSNRHQAEKTCRSTADVETILTFLTTNLATDFVQTKVPALETQYVLRLAMTDGSQLTLGYIASGQEAWLLIGGVPYETAPMDFDSLWDALKTEETPFQSLPEGDYLRIEDAYPDTDWGTDLRYGYLQRLDTVLTYDEILWIDDADAPNGFRLENGETALQLPLSEHCQFWYLADHNSPCCQVTQEQFLSHIEAAPWQVLLRLYVQNGKIVAVCEQFLP